MARTFQQTLDNISPHGITAPIGCRRVTIREAPNPTTFITTWGVSNALRVGGPDPARDSDPYPVYQGEAVTFEPSYPAAAFLKDETICYMQAGSGTITLAIFCE